MSRRTCTVTISTNRTTRTTSIDIDERLYQAAVNGNKAARDRICIIVKQKFRLSRYVAWGSFTIDLDQPPLKTGVCDDCAWCNLGNHHQCKPCTLGAR